MKYLGENSHFSFRDGFCEQLPSVKADSAAISDMGKSAAAVFRRLAAGCDSDRLRPALYSLCAGISEAGKDVFLCENTALPPFRYGLSAIACDCGIYLSESAGKLRLSFFAENGFPLDSSSLSRIMTGSSAVFSGSCGKISSLSSLCTIFRNNICDSFPSVVFPVNAGISCGNKSVRRLWQEFFSDTDDSLIFQVSDDGQRVNAYSSELGFISYDRLLLTYSIKLWESGETVWLPDKFHFAAEKTARLKGFTLKRFSTDAPVPAEAAAQRFLSDPLFLCISLASDRNAFRKAVSETPQFTTAKREVAVVLSEKAPFEKAILEPDGTVFISKSGKNTVSLTAQSYSAETAAELCAVWDEKLRRLSACNNLFHSQQ